MCEGLGCIFLVIFYLGMGAISLAIPILLIYGLWKIIRGLGSAYNNSNPVTTDQKQEPSTSDFLITIKAYPWWAKALIAILLIPTILFVLTYLWHILTDNPGWAIFFAFFEHLF